MVETKKNISRLDWVDGLKAFAILGILLNHFVEEFGAGPWFSNPSYNWPPVSYRLSHIFPDGHNPFAVGIKFLGWLGDMGPGVFILLSGFALTWSQLRTEKSAKDFYKGRLIRIFPLYITIHIIILVFALLVKHPANLDVFSPKVFLSFLGLRFTDSLFFFMNPSWWFVWLIIQLYFVFPFLFRVLKNKGMTYFFILTFIITILSRLAGIIHLSWSNNLYYWMTGMFAGTRLVEFAAGMLLARILITESSVSKIFMARPLKVFIYSFLIYVIGFICSWTYAGSLISNFLITVGLSGIFFSLFKINESKKPVRNAVIFIGKNSFCVFLLHQPLMNYLGDHLVGLPKIIFLVAVIILSFPVGYILEKSVNKAIELFSIHYHRIEPYLTGKGITTFIYLLTLMIIFVNASSLVISRVISLYANILALFYLFVLLIYNLATFKKFNKLTKPIIALFLIVCGFFYTILPAEWIPLVSIALALAFPVCFILKRVLRPKLAVIISAGLIAVFFSFTEFYLRKSKPLETPVWSEFPALQTDKKTVYSLIPNKTTHLRYNNYDYVLKTNSLGFNSPEIDLSVKDSNTFRLFIVGDAFSMPEGVDYQHSYPSLLERILKDSLKNKLVQVINGGVTGYGPNEMSAQINAYIDTIQPDLIINELFVNEFQEINYNAAQRLKNIGFTRHDSKRLKFWGYSQILLRYEKILRIATRRTDYQFNYSKSLLNLYDKSSAYYSDTVIQKIDNYITGIKSICDSNNTRLMLLYVPGQIEVSSAGHIAFYPSNVNLLDTNKYNFEIAHQIINKLCKKHKTELLDTRELLKTDREQPVYFEESWHWNKQGHKLIANVLATKILTQKYYERE